MKPKIQSEDWLKIILVLTLTLSLFLVLAMAVAVQAGGGKQLESGKNMYKKLTPEQAVQVFDLREQFMKDTANLRRDLAYKKSELAALKKGTAPDQNQIQAKQNEIKALKDQLQQRSLAFRQEAQKTAPQISAGRGQGKGQKRNQNM